MPVSLCGSYMLINFHEINQTFLDICLNLNGTLSKKLRKGRFPVLNLYFTKYITYWKYLSCRHVFPPIWNWRLLGRCICANNYIVLIARTVSTAVSRAVSDAIYENLDTIPDRSIQFARGNLTWSIFIVYRRFYIVYMIK